MFDFPEGIGPVECVNVEHEEVVLIPRWVQCERVTFKYGLGQEFIDVLRTLHKLGLDSTEPVSVRGVQVAPRDVVAAALPDPATLGERMTGRTCAGTWVTGTGKDGAPRSTYLYHVVDNEHDDARVRQPGRGVADGDQPGRRARAARRGRVEGHRRARPRGVPAEAVPGAAGGVRLTAWADGVGSEVQRVPVSASVGGGWSSSPGGAVSDFREKNSLKNGREASMITPPSIMPPMPIHSGSVMPRIGFEETFSAWP